MLVEQHRDTGLHRAAWIVFGLYLIGVLGLTMWPNLAHTEVPHWAHLTLNWLNVHGIAMTFSQLERFANILMFFPFGLLSALLLSHHKFHWHIAHRSLLVIGAGILFSALIETVQRVIPGRVSDPGDILMNSSGALLGALIGALIAHWRSGRHPSRIQ